MASRHSHLVILIEYEGRLGEKMSPTSPVVERLYVGVRGLFQSFAVVCKSVYFATASPQPVTKHSLHQSLKPCMARNQWSEGMREKGRDTARNDRNRKKRQEKMNAGEVKCQSKQIKKKEAKELPTSRQSKNIQNRQKGKRRDQKEVGQTPSSLQLVQAESLTAERPQS